MKPTKAKRITRRNCKQSIHYNNMINPKEQPLQPRLAMFARGLPYFDPVPLFLRRHSNECW